MPLQDFRCILNEPEVTDELADRICAAGCDDGVLASRNGVVAVYFGRRAPSLEQAVTSAVADLTAVGIHVIRVETEEQTLVNQLNQQLFADAS